jgi:predicted RNA-binding Zn-ribbon protein involved in translation (DUF1610 family)
MICLKRRYPSFTAAQRAGDAARYLFDRRLTPYHCPDCGRWHLTGQRQARRAAQDEGAEMIWRVR